MKVRIGSQVAEWPEYASPFLLNVIEPSLRAATPAEMRDLPDSGKRATGRRAAAIDISHTAEEPR